MTRCLTPAVGNVSEEAKCGLTGSDASLRRVKELPNRVARPQTFMEIGGYPHYENVCSNFLAFFVDPEGPHGLGRHLVAGAEGGLGATSPSTVRSPRRRAMSSTPSLNDHEHPHYSSGPNSLASETS